jgi:hypothetical protein
MARRKRYLLMIGAVALLVFALTRFTLHDGTAPATAAETAPEPPTLVTAPAEEIGFTKAILVGSINPHGSPTTYYFAWGTSYSSLPNKTPVLSAGEGTVSLLFYEPLSNLESGREYFFQLVATNAGGTSKGSIGHLVTLKDTTGPSFPASFEVTVTNEAPWAEPAVFLPTATDPPLKNGHAGSGVAATFYRYSLDGQPFTAWASTEFQYFEVPGAVAGDSLALEAYATDAVGNAGPTRSATVTIPAAVEEEGEEVLEEG